MKTAVSAKLYREARRYIPGGVNSPVRAFRAVGRARPLFIKRAHGSHLYDEDGNGFVDYVMSWGAMMLGHDHAAVRQEIRRAAESGTSYGCPTRHETELAKAIRNAIPSVEKVRFVSSGTEAVMSAIRLCRGFTGRDKVVKFEGSYHGHVDSLLMKAGSGQATYASPGSAGLTRSTAGDTIVCPYNDLETFASVVKKEYRKIACVIVEPISANMGVVLPREDFLYRLRETASKYGIALIFDEVVTGFRLRYGGVQDYFGIKPDLTCLGKIIGGGLPIGAYGGRREIMDRVAPTGPVYQAGTLAGNPVVVRAGIAALKALSALDYGILDERAAELCRSAEYALNRKGAGVRVNRAGSLFTVFFTSKKVIDFTSAKTSDTRSYARYFWRMLELGVYLPPSQFEACFLSFAHSRRDVADTVRALERMKV